MLNKMSSMDEARDDEPSLFDGRTVRSGAIFDTGSDAVDLLRKKSIVDDYNEEIRKAEFEIHRQKRLMDAAILAVCECKKSQVLCSLTLAFAKKVKEDFSENGFAGKVVAEFLRLVKERFFLQMDTEVYTYNDHKKCENLADDVECININIGNSFNDDDSRIDGSHIGLEFLNKKAKKHFWLSIPLKENTSFGPDNFEDEFLGKYLLTAEVLVKTKNYEFEKLKNGEVKAVVKDDNGAFIMSEDLVPEFVEALEKRTIATDYSAARIAKSIETYLTSNELDKSDIRNWRRMRSDRDWMFSDHNWMFSSMTY